MTSEEILNLPKQPEESCPGIDKALGKLTEGMRSILSAQRLLKNSDDRYAIDALTDIESAENNFYYLQDGFEYCRSQSSAIREWGQSWKDLAKELLERYEPERLEERKAA